jgi:hypothetical protein
MFVGVTYAPVRTACRGDAVRRPGTVVHAGPTSPNTFARVHRTPGATHRVALHCLPVECRIVCTTRVSADPRARRCRALPFLRNEHPVAAGLVPAPGQRAFVVKSGPCTQAGCGCDARGFTRGHVPARHCRARTVSSERPTGTGRFRTRCCMLVASPAPPPTSHTAGGDLAAR